LRADLLCCHGYKADLIGRIAARRTGIPAIAVRSEEHTSELQSLTNLVCRLLLEKKKKIKEFDRERPRERHSNEKVQSSEFEPSSKRKAPLCAWKRGSHSQSSTLSQTQVAGDDHR